MSISDFGIIDPTEPEKPKDSDFKEDPPPVGNTESPKVSTDPKPTDGGPTPEPSNTMLGVAEPVSPPSSNSGFQPIGVASTVRSPVTTTDPAEALASVLGNIQDKIGTGANLKMMIFGEPGSFKSSFTATAPNQIAVDLEDGLISAKVSPHGVAENVRPYPWRGFDNFNLFVDVLTGDPEELNWVEVVGVDTFSEMHKRGLQELMEREHRKRPSINQFVPETEHHTENNERMLRTMRKLLDTRRNVIISTHSRTVEPKNKPAKTFADFSESLSNKLMGMMDVVGYCEKRIVDNKVVMVMRFQGDGTVHCKQRIGLSDELINPTYADILKVWEESKNK